MKRTIFLVDMNAFFIGCEMARNPSLKGKPAAVAGDPKKRSGIILAANYEARKYKVKTTMTIHEALKLCPDLILIPPDHRYYENKSREVMGILSSFSPVIQKNSIDEAWIDMTGCENLFGPPLKSAEMIMKKIMDMLDLWCSIGISENKFLAKMASELKKPLGITELWQKDIAQKMWPLPVREMYGIGAQTEKRLAELSIFTIGDLAGFDPKILVRSFGKYGEELHRLANGIDDSPVVEHQPHESKSISRSTTLSEDITDLDAARKVLLYLAEDVGMEARRTGFKGKTISITIKYADFKSITRQRAVPHTYLTREIYRAGIELLEGNWNSHRPVRLLGIALSGSSEDGASQISFFDLEAGSGLVSGIAENREEKLEKAVDEIRQKFGNDKIKRCKIL